MSRTGQQRLDAIMPAIARRDEFELRVTAAEGDAVRCADLMAEAICMKIESNGMETVGRHGKVTVSMENVCASHCLIYARDAYLRARGSNAPPIISYRDDPRPSEVIIRDDRDGWPA